MLLCQYLAISSFIPPLCSGTDNSKSTPKLLEFWYDKPMESGDSEVSKGVKKLPYEVRDLMPDYEYMVRCGWLPNGQW